MVSTHHIWLFRIRIPITNIIQVDFEISTTFYYFAGGVKTLVPEAVKWPRVLSKSDMSLKNCYKKVRIIGIDTNFNILLQRY